MPSMTRETVLAIIAEAYAKGERPDLRGADLRDLDLSWVDFHRTGLDGASLDPIKADVYRVLDSSPDEVGGLLQALKEGQVDGSAYEGECACLIGTLAKLRHCDYRSLHPHSSSLAERWFLAIGEGDTPETHPVAAITARWIEEWLGAREATHD